MPKAPTLVRLTFTQGNKSSFDPSVVPPDALWQSRNVTIDESGIIQVAPGFSSIMASLGPGRIQGATEAFGFLFFVWNNTLYKADQDGNVTQIGTGIGASPTDPVTLVRWTSGGAEILYVFTGNGIYSSDGTTVSLVTPYTPAAGEQANILRAEDGSQNLQSVPAKSRLVVLRVSTGQRLAVSDGSNTIWLSEPLNAAYYPANQFINLPADGGHITGLSERYGALIIYRDRDIWAYFKADETDTSSPGPVRQDPSVGCVAPRSIVNVPGIGEVFLGGPQGVVDNVYALQGVAAIENQVRAVPVGDDIKKQLIEACKYGVEDAVGIYFDRQYRLSIPQNLGEDRTFHLSLLQQTPGWFVRSAPRASVWTVFKDKLYAGSWLEGKIYEMDDGSLLYDGAAIPFFVAFRREITQPGPARIKRLYLYLPSKGILSNQTVEFFGGAYGDFSFAEGDQEMVTIILGTHQDLNVTLVTDSQEFSVKNLHVRTRRAQGVILEGYEPVQIYEASFYPSLKAHFLQVRLEANTPRQNIAVLGYGFDHTVKGRIRGIREGVSV